MKSIVNLFIDEKLWIADISKKNWKKSFRALLSVTPFPFKKEINVILTNDENIRKMNKQFRGIDKPTNVLSFPQYSKDEIASIKPGEKILLGDVVMAYNTIDNEASMFEKRLFDRVSHLFVHGVLHTLGYDHAMKFDQHTMEALEIQILLSFNIEHPYTLGRKI